MPLLSIDTNRALDDAQASAFIRTASAAVAEVLGKPERDAPLAYLELKSIGLPEDRTKALSQALCDLVSSHLGVATDRIYIEFANAPRHLWGWNSATF